MCIYAFAGGETVYASFFFSKKKKMFKKPIANIKTFSPLRSSDRRHFQNEAIEAYPVLKDQYVMPNDLRSAKFIAQTSAHGIVYTSADQPLWISFENMAPVPTGIYYS